MDLRLVKCFSLWKNGLRSSLFLFMLAGLMGCRSVRKMEMVTVTDTVRIVVTDTVVRESVTVVRDTIRIKVTDSVVVKVDADGNVSRERYHDEERQRTEDRLQTTDYRQRTTEDRKRTTDYGQRTTEEEVKVERRSWWDRLVARVGVMGLMGIMGLMGFVVGWIVRAVKPN